MDAPFDELRTRTPSSPRRILAITCAGLLVLACAAGVYRQTGPRLHGDQFGISSPVHVNEAFNFGVHVWTGSSVNLRSVTLVGATSALSGQTRVAVRELRSGSGELGSSLGDPRDDGYVVRPIIGRSVTATKSRPLKLVISVTPTKTGVYHFDGVRLRYGSGLRARTTTLHVDICVVAIEQGAAIDANVPERCASPD